MQKIELEFIEEEIMHLFSIKYIACKSDNKHIKKIKSVHF